MSIHFDASRDRFVVRWKQDGRRRVRRFRSEADAIAFDAALLRPLRPAPIAASVPSAAAGDGIYAYETRGGTRYRFVFRQSDGTLSTRRGFTSRRAAATARRRLVESIEPLASFLIGTGARIHPIRVVGQSAILCGSGTRRLG